MRRFALAPIVLSLVFALACGGSTHNSPPPPSVSISISPTAANVSLNQTTQFDAKVQGASSTSVTWSVKEENGGTVTSGGMYHAPWLEGTYHLTATAVADATKTATATITVTATIKVTAFTAFLEALPGGTSSPWSVTPVLGMLLADGTWQAAPIIDPTTNAPMDTPLYDVFLSADGTKAVGSMPLYDAQGDVAWNIVIFNSDGSGMTTLTKNIPGTGDRYPELSPDGKFIVYSHWSVPVEVEIWKMNTDGSNPQTISSKLCPADYHCGYTHPSFSPDGSKIVYHYDESFSDCCSYVGIGSTNADGTGTENYLTGCRLMDPLCVLDDMPTFTNDGNKISFTRTGVGSQSTSLYIMNADGSNVVPLYETVVADTTAAQPRRFADRILFSSNVDNVGTNAFEIYSVMPDGSNVTRLTNNSVYDGFDTSWINYPSFTAPAASEKKAESR